VLFAALIACVVATAVERQPNIVIIVSDDSGYADFSLNGGKHFPTPNIDRIAVAGVTFTQGYVSASVCSPSRAGFLTGRYQQRFGHFHNIPPKYSTSNGLPVEETTLADALHKEGYRTIALGKWHLGYAPKFHPLSRGFDDYYGFLQGARSYWQLGEKQTRLNRLLRDRKPIKENFQYITDALGEEAVNYIDAHASQPFFLYLAFNATHTPLHATDEKLATTDASLSKKRKKLAAMTMSMDDAIGEVLEALERNGLTDDTIVIFFNDNGGQTGAGASNAPLRGKKGQPYEGGIRVPFVAKWPGHWPAGLKYDQPVSTLDIFPTVLKAAGGDPASMKRALDGVDLSPHLHPDAGSRPHETLYWQRKNNVAVRDGDWKLLRYGGDGAMELYNIKVDPGETNDRFAEEAELAARLAALLEAWQATHSPARW
jgi:arylsulfatase A-like enzyme